MDSFHMRELVLLPEKRTSTQKGLGENCRNRQSIRNKEPSVSMRKRNKVPRAGVPCPISLSSLPPGEDI